MTYYKSGSLISNRHFLLLYMLNLYLLHKHRSTVGDCTVLQLFVLNICKIVGFEVFTVVTMNNAIFWDMAPCGSCQSVSLLLTFFFT
jgi:hypothetical protein